MAPPPLIDEIPQRLTLQAFDPSTRKADRPMTRLWPSVGGADNVHGDRNLFCGCGG